MKKSSMTLLSLIALSGTAFGQSASNLVTAPTVPTGSHQFTQGGSTSELTLCTYELCHLDDNGLLQISPVAAGSMSAIIGQASEPDADKYLVFYPAGKERIPNSRRILRNRYMVTLSEGADLNAIQQRCGIKSIKLVRPGSNVALCEEESSGRVLFQLSNVLNDPDVVSAEPLLARKRYKRAIPTDPFYPPNTLLETDGNYQWYLNNDGVNGGEADVDINLEPALDRASGNGITVAVLDDGLSIDHEELVVNATGPHLNVFATTPDEESDPTTFDATLTHGTNVGGLIGAAFNNVDDEGNGVGMSGVAPRVTLSGIRMLGGAIDDADEAAALGFMNDEIDVYNSSWGPDDTTLDLEAPGRLALAALQAGAEVGRGGLGNVYVWAAGDGGEIGDNSNYDGYANSKYTIAVGSITDGGTRAGYSERGANLVVVAPSDGGAQQVLTTSFGLDIDEDGFPFRTSTYDTTFGGTSASAALVSGVVALMLEENPNLTWRDVQDILIRTARRTEEDGEWETNAAGIDFNHNYGAGLVDAGAAVQSAFQKGLPSGELLGPVQRHIRSRFFTSNPNDPENESGIVPDDTGGSLLVGFDMSEDVAGNPLENLRVEHVEFNATIITQSRSDLEIVLISPNGTQSILQEVADNNDEQSISRWTFMTVRNWGEGSAGTWVVRITDRVTGNPATLNNATLVINGSPASIEDAPVTQQPILTSGRLVTVNQGSSFTYNLETSGADSIVVGDLPTGIVYNESTRTISGVPTTPGLFTVPVTLLDAEGTPGVFNINFVIRPTAVALGDAVGLPGIPAVFGGDVPWDFELTDTNDGASEEPRSARSGLNIPDLGRSIFGFNNLPRGVLFFDWKTSSQEGADRLWFNRGGAVPQVWDAFISGERAWGRTAVMLPDGSNDVRWIYSKDGAASVGEDRGLVDNVEFLEMDKYLADIARAGNIEGVNLEFDSRTLLMPFEFPVGSPSPDGTRELLRTSTIGNGQTVSISGWLEGPGTFSFRAFNFAEPGDVFEFLLDGVVVDSRQGAGAGASPLTPMTRPWDIGEGRHRFQLRFRKDFTGSDARVIGSELIDGVLIDDIKFVTEASFSKFASQYGGGFDPRPEADGDGDGYTNHQEYAFGGNVLVSDIPKYLPKTVSVGGRDYIEYGIDQSRTDLDYEVQQSSNLQAWVPAEFAQLDRTEGDVEVYRIPVASVPGRRNLFYRVIATSR